MKVSPLKIKSNSDSDANARKYLKAQVPFLPTVDEYPDLFHVKHGFVNPEKLLIAIMSVAFVTPELHMDLGFLRKINMDLGFSKRIPLR